MNFERDVNFRIATSGTGLWSNVRKKVTVNGVYLTYVSDDEKFGELRAYFDMSDWNVDEDGMIYTDPHWLDGFRSCMMTLGFSPQAVSAIGYSEAGMQGSTFVSLDVFENFLIECTPFYRFVVNREIVNF